jgi:hypothetical protein
MKTIEIPEWLIPIALVCWMAAGFMIATLFSKPKQ